MSHCRMHLASSRNDIARNMGKHKKEDKSDGGEEKAPVEICGEKFRCLAAVGLAHKQEHGGSQGRAKPHESIHIDDRYGIENGIHGGPYPTSYLYRDKTKDEAYDI